MATKYPVFPEMPSQAQNSVPPLSPLPASSDAAPCVAWWAGTLSLVTVIIIAWYGAGDMDWIYDDHPNIVNEVPALEAVWSGGEIFEGTQRPLTRLSFAVDYAMFGLNPGGFHRTNVVLHLVAALLAFTMQVVALRLLRRRGVVGGTMVRGLVVIWAISAIWALLPVQTAAVSYVVQRAEVLVAIFSFLAFLALFRSEEGTRRAIWNLVMVLAVAGALLSKPTAVFLPLLLLVADRAICGGGWAAWWSRRGGVHVLSFLCLSLLVFTGVAESLFATDDGTKGAGLGVAGTSVWEQITTVPGVVGAYLRLLVDPGAMSIDHGVESYGGVAVQILGWISLVAVALLSVWALWRRRWWAIYPVGAVLTLAPVASIVPLADPVADYRAYVPSFFVVGGGVVLVVWCTATLTRRSARSGTSLGPIGVVVLLGIVTAEVFGVRARNRDYLEPERLWSDVIERRPDHWRSLSNRAATAILEGRYDDAAADLVAAERLQPGNPTVQLNLAALDVYAGRPEEALVRLTLVARVRGEDPVFLATRGDALRELGRSEDAESDYRALVALAPSDPQARLAWGNSLSDLERFEEAAREFGHAASLTDDDDLIAGGRYNEGNMYLRLERWSEAIGAYEAALEANPEHAGARRWLAVARSVVDE